MGRTAKNYSSEGFKDLKETGANKCYYYHTMSACS